MTHQRIRFKSRGSLQSTIYSNREIKLEFDKQFIPTIEPERGQLSNAPRNPSVQTIVGKIPGGQDSDQLIATDVKPTTYKKLSLFNCPSVSGICPAQRVVGKHPVCKITKGELQRCSLPDNVQRSECRQSSNRLRNRPDELVVRKLPAWGACELRH